MAAAAGAPTVEDLTAVPAPGRRSVLLFWAPWQEDSAPGGVCDAVLRALAASPARAAAAAGEDDTGLRLGRVEAEACADVSRHYGVTAVPTFLLLRPDGTVFERIEGSRDVSEVARALQRLRAAPDDAPAANAATAATTAAPLDAAGEQDRRLRKRLQALTRAHPVMLFMKGTPAAPRCGFSRQAVELLQARDIAFGSFDILQDEAVRQGLKAFSDWPTYPQLYANGELVGGLDILREMAQDASAPLAVQLGIEPAAAAGGAMATATEATGAPPSLQDRLRALVRQERVMLFMKGLPSAPQCGFSRQIVDLLEEQGVHDYGAFDILQDMEVRQGLKELSDWPTYPQLYVDGELIGGLDIVREMAEDGSLKETLSLS